MVVFIHEVMLSWEVGNWSTNMLLFFCVTLRVEPSIGRYLPRYFAVLSLWLSWFQPIDLNFWDGGCQPIIVSPYLQSMIAEMVSSSATQVIGGVSGLTSRWTLLSTNSWRTLPHEDSGHRRGTVKLTSSNSAPWQWRGRNKGEPPLVDTGLWVKTWIFQWICEIASSFARQKSNSICSFFLPCSSLIFSKTVRWPSQGLGSPKPGGVGFQCLNFEASCRANTHYWGYWPGFDQQNADGINQGLLNVPFWVYWTSPYSSHLVDHIPNDWVMFNGDI